MVRHTKLPSLTVFLRSFDFGMGFVVVVITEHAPCPVPDDDDDDVEGTVVVAFDEGLVVPQRLHSVL